ncbi:SDR family oxidoreductase [Alkalibaculum sp. M08DMB]|uniref:SDR family oxidoreductase n=1 Tax=Alkalibaculum sporogenes TaxID=2655001 RepID=A0A6A7K5K5_9FIRM|nr:3-oxoacyl-ACP reductase family protein [Alkalibaculum sporogenes]MPW24662.1 SDR family oxidoreductase [Alkalibaculum sporogenes]
MEKKLINKVAMVTGAARGIGREYALRLAKLGANIVITDIDLTAGNYKESDISANTVKEELENLGVKALAFQGDGTDEEFVVDVVKSTMNEFGHIDILINNIGGTGGAGPGLATEMSVEKFKKVIDINLTTTFIFSKHVANIMKKQRSGKIINISSVAGDVPLFVVQPHYAAGKAAVISLTKTLALELAQYGITVNAIAPGYISTVKWDAHFSSQVEELVKKVPIGRIGTTEDCAKVIEFLATDLSDYLTGQTIQVDGGLLALNPSSTNTDTYHL